jgi:hypothetical protein
VRRRGFVGLAAGAIILAALAAVALRSRDGAVSDAAAGQPALPGLADKLASVNFIRLRRGDATVNFKRSGEAWTVVEKGGYPADQERVRKLLLQLAQLELVEPKTDRSELLARLDLDDPANGTSTLVAVQDRSGAPPWQLIIGRRRPNDIAGGEEGVYVRKPDSPQAWLARGAFALGGDARAWLDRRIIDIAPTRVASVVLTASDGSSVTVARTSSDLPFAIDGLAADARPKPDQALAAPAGVLDALTLADVKPAPAPLMADEDGTTAALTTFDGLVVGLRLAPPDRGDWLAVEISGFGVGEDAAKALNARLAPWRFAIPADRAKLLRTTLSDLVLPRGS